MCFITYVKGLEMVSWVGCKMAMLGNWVRYQKMYRTLVLTKVARREPDIFGIPYELGTREGIIKG